MKSLSYTRFLCDQSRISSLKLLEFIPRGGFGRKPRIHKVKKVQGRDFRDFLNFP